jgi:hypothetical protein
VEAIAGRVARQRAITRIRRDEGGEHDKAGVGEERRNLAGAADVLATSSAAPACAAPLII